MIKFFRTIRKKLLLDNKFSKYLLYAIGEIILVVIGILIALQINNRNELSKNHEKYLKILKEVQHDALKNIENSNRVLADYKRKDSLIELVLNDKIDHKDYATDLWELRALITSTSNIRIQNNGYLKLIQKMDIIAEEDTDFINLLNDNYIYLKYEIDRSVTRLDVITDRYLDYLAEHKEWYYIYARDLNNGQPATGDYINYFINNPFYKNAVIIYQIGSRNNLMHYTLLFRASEIKICFKTAEILDNKDELPSDLLPKNVIALRPKELQSFVGTYETQRGFKVTFVIQEEHLYCVWPNEKEQFFYKGNDQFIGSMLSELKFVRDSTNVVVGINHKDYIIGDFYFEKY